MDNKSLVEKYQDARDKLLLHCGFLDKGYIAPLYFCDYGYWGLGIGRVYANSGNIDAPAAATCRYRVFAEHGYKKAVYKGKKWTIITCISKLDKSCYLIVLDTEKEKFFNIRSGGYRFIKDGKIIEHKKKTITK